MPKKKSDKAVLAEIREVISDMNSNFMVKSYRDDPPMKKGDTDKLDSDMAVSIIEDLVDRKKGSLTRDYLRTKREARAALKPST